MNSPLCCWADLSEFFVLLRDTSTVVALAAESVIHSFPPPARVSPATLGLQMGKCPVTSSLFRPSGCQVTIYFPTAYRDLLVGWKCTQQAFSAA